MHILVGEYVLLDILHYGVGVGAEVHHEGCGVGEGGGVVESEGYLHLLDVVGVVLKDAAAEVGCGKVGASHEDC